MPRSCLFLPALLPLSLFLPDLKDCSSFLASTLALPLSVTSLNSPLKVVFKNSTRAFLYSRNFQALPHLLRLEPTVLAEVTGPGWSGLRLPPLHAVHVLNLCPAPATCEPYDCLRRLLALAPSASSFSSLFSAWLHFSLSFTSLLKYSLSQRCLPVTLFKAAFSLSPVFVWLPQNLSLPKIFYINLFTVSFLRKKETGLKTGSLLLTCFPGAVAS